MVMKTWRAVMILPDAACLRSKHARQGRSKSTRIRLATRTPMLGGLPTCQHSRADRVRHVKWRSEFGCVAELRRIVGGIDVLISFNHRSIVLFARCRCSVVGMQKKERSSDHSTLKLNIRAVRRFGAGFAKASVPRRRALGKISQPESR